ncbi:hypothetical protein NUV26_06835 [Burkholderia pseudomultivorans]|uniref:hypothetical protein n=1 Tax=Burkholderia pseudomultivorans TaxID=1207504 RepID=UPI000B1503AA|nr:hypothetical protein [Burkholderia pseudomultivorans]MDS0791862.1 hypothetical protein [Burkholderia pseudomultivorans]
MGTINMRTDVVRMSLCTALAFLSVAAGAQPGSVSRIDSAKRIGASTGIASKGQHLPESNGTSAADPLLGGPTAYDDAQLANFGAPAEIPAPRPYEKMTDIPPTPTERLALASARAGIDSRPGAGLGTRSAPRAAPAANGLEAGMPAVYPTNVYPQGSAGKLAVYPLPW